MSELNAEIETCKKIYYKVRFTMTQEIIDDLIDRYGIEDEERHGISEKELIELFIDSEYFDNVEWMPLDEEYLGCEVLDYKWSE